MNDRFSGFERQFEKLFELMQTREQITHRSPAVPGVFKLPPPVQSVVLQDEPEDSDNESVEMEQDIPPTPTPPEDPNTSDQDQRDLPSDHDEEIIEIYVDTDELNELDKGNEDDPSPPRKRIRLSEPDSPPKKTKDSSYRQESRHTRDDSPPARDWKFIDDRVRRPKNTQRLRSRDLRHTLSNPKGTEQPRRSDPISSPTDRPEAGSSHRPAKSTREIDTRMVELTQQGTIPEFVEQSETQESSYIDVLGWIQEQFPETIELQSSTKSTSSLVESLFDQERPSSTLPALPWSKGCLEALTDADKTISGNSAKGLGPLKIGKSAPAPDFNYKYYRIQTMDSIQNASVNRSIETLVSPRDKESVKKLKTELSAEEMKSWEISTRKSRVLQSALDWQLSTAVKMILDVCEKSPSPGLEKVLRLLLSAGKTTSQMQKESSNFLTNLILKRRDPILNKLLRQVPDQDKLDLRSSSIKSAELFDDDIIHKTAGKLQENINREVQLRMVQQSRTAPPQPKLTPKNGNTSKPKGKSNTNQQNTNSFSSFPQGGVAAPGESTRKVTLSNKSKFTRGRRA